MRAAVSLLVLAVVVAGLGGAGAASASAVAPSEQSVVRPMRRAALRVVVRTTSDWAQVDLPGVSAGHLVVRRTGGRAVQPTAEGLVVQGRAGRPGAVTVDVVTEVPDGFDRGGITVTQGALGRTAVRVQNRTGTPVDAATIRTSPRAAQRRVAITRRALLAGQQLEWVRADDERRVLAFTYPWFDDAAKTDALLSVHPLSVANFSLLHDAVAMAAAARSYGIDGFVMSFSGGIQHGLALHQSLQAADATDGTSTILLETTEAGSAEVAEQWLREALRQSDHPAFMRLDGIPVVFAFESARVSAAQWRDIARRLAGEGTPVRIVGDSWTGGRGPIDGQYRYNALLESADDRMSRAELTTWNRTVSRGLRARATLGAGEPGLVVATAQPGWDDRPLRGEDRMVVPRNGTATYDDTWQAALASEADWVVITSWNEWYEGTGIAPSAEHRTDALEATQAWSEAFTGT